MKEKLINDEVEKVNRALSQEGMPLTDDEKLYLKEIISGKKTYNEVRQRIINDSIQKKESVNKK